MVNGFERLHTGPVVTGRQHRDGDMVPSHDGIGMT